MGNFSGVNAGKVGAPGSEYLFILDEFLKLFIGVNGSAPVNGEVAEFISDLSVAEVIIELLFR